MKGKGGWNRWKERDDGIDGRKERMEKMEGKERWNRGKEREIGIEGRKGRME